MDGECSNQAIKFAFLPVNLLSFWKFIIKAEEFEHVPGKEQYFIDTNKKKAMKLDRNS